MATKGPKTTAKPTVPKPARAVKPAAPKAEAAAPKVEKALPEPVAETIVAAAAPEQAPAAEAASQEVVHAVETAPEQAQAAVAETVNATEALPNAASESIKETITMATTFENKIPSPQALFGDFNDRTKAAVEKSTKLVEEANEFAKGNVEALVESGRIAAKGLETFGQDAAEYSRKSFESATATFKTLASVKSPTEFFKLQSDFVRGAFDSYVAEASKNTEALIKLASDAAQPISNRFAVAVEKAKATA
ncbi:phasin family protein [Sphingomonas sp. MMS12-HWE2-04]|uniref:phasin family protein n=1 Tax=Sphingomonas sp. MMS12-HWE2-04 TaxID=3234199 RepID=UPI00384C47CA